MSLIQTIHPEQAEGSVAEVYREIQAAFGFVPNAIQLESIHPDSMRRHWDSIKEQMRHPSLSQELLTSIRLLVSEQERCEYCIGLNAGMLMQMHGWSHEQVQALVKDLNSAPLSKRELALLNFAMKASQDSNSTSAEDLTELKAMGVSEREAFDVVQLAAQQAAADVVLNVFKVEADLH